MLFSSQAFVHCNDYYGVQLVKQLSVMPDKMKARYYIHTTTNLSEL